MSVQLKDFQEKALQYMKNGCILCGGTGSGKSITSLAYYYTQNGGKLSPLEPMDDCNPVDLYIITTALKRDKLEWDGELGKFLLSQDPELNHGQQKVKVDSWNNIKKYVDVKNAFFIFDEQRVVGSGEWTKSFLKITKNNQWILLSATPGDTWTDYIPVFIANSFYKNKTEFIREHVVYKRYSKFPQIDRYVNTRRLSRLRDSILVDMDFDRTTVQHHIDVFTDYDKLLYKDIVRNRWNIWEEKPIENASEYCQCLRKVVNSDESKQIKILEIFEKHNRLIVFYNFDYELDILKSLYFGDDVKVAEWNGHKHQPIPETKKWVYLVQYNAGSEGWNCIKTDTIVFFSENYSYRIMTQAAGRIDRLNTLFIDLYFYHLKTKSTIDVGIARALGNKKKFNENRFGNVIKNDINRKKVA